MRGEVDAGGGEFEALWRALCERVYPLRDERGVGDGRRLFHQDLGLLTEMDLEFDTLRARFRLCLEEDFSDRLWLLERIDTIEDEQARRAEAAWPPRDAAVVPAQPRRALDAASPPRRPHPQPEPEPDREAAPVRPRFGHVGYRARPGELAGAVRNMLEQLERQATILADDGDTQRAQDGRGAR